MATLLNDCPRCSAIQITFDVNAIHLVPNSTGIGGYRNNLLSEVFGVCKHCNRSTVFYARVEKTNAQQSQLSQLAQSNIHLNSKMEIIGFVSQKDKTKFDPPSHVPDAVAEAFREASTCLSVNCFNAASAMFRLCLDLATKPLLPDENDANVVQPNKQQRRMLGARIPWLIDNDFLPQSIDELADCVKEDGNDGVHDGTISHNEAEDLLDFTCAILERLYTEPAKIQLAKERRLQRRKTAEENGS